MNKKYKNFLKTKEWLLIREARKVMDGNKCTRCGSTDHLEVHHKTYELDPTRGLLVLDNLITLCRSCHDATHGYSYGRIDLDELSYCRNCAWMNDNIGYCVCLRRESPMFCKEVDRNWKCEWYWPWASVPNEDRPGPWPAEKVYEFIAMNEEDNNGTT